uniref:Uncharacterized protein n=1 Tax=Rhizophagus irregularis (strain DAOM 181602 / DAOM 197198 / MUCL 43194) TaxID=747089 RepID=U9T787_RHIID
MVKTRGESRTFQLEAAEVLMVEQDFIYRYIADAGDNVITKVGAENFAAVVSDHASACTATKKELLNDTKYKHILPIRCITYHVNLISTDICKQYLQRMLFQNVKK